MKREYYSTNGLWLIITTLVIYVISIYFLVTGDNENILEYSPFVIVIILNTLMLIFYGKELFSKKPLLVLEEDQLIYRGMLKTHTIMYKDIKLIQRTYNGTRNKKKVNRIGVQLKEDDKIVYIITQSINHEPNQLFEEMKQAIYKKEAKK